MELSLEEQQEKIEEAFCAAFPQLCRPSQNEIYGDMGGGEVLEVEATYNDHLIACLNGSYYRVNFTTNEAGYSFMPLEQWLPVVEQEIWQEVKSLNKETLVYFGGAVKALGDGRVGGYLVRFGTPDNPDLEGDYFDPETDFGRAEKSAVYYQHGLDPVLKRRVLGEGLMRKDEVGVWIEAQLEMRDEYERAIYGMAEKGKLGWSSGTAPHLVERTPMGKTYHLKTWPLGLDASLTPTPAEPRTLAIPLKTLKPQQAEPQGTGDVSGNAPGAEPERKHITQSTQKEKKTMAISNADLLDALKQLAEGKLTEGDEREALPEKFQSYENQMKAINSRLEAFDEVLDIIKKSGKAKDAGYVAPDSETDHAEAKSFGDFLVAIQNKNRTRLDKVYKTALAESSGPAGGYVVPTEYGALIEKNGAELNVLQMAGAMVERMTVNEKEIPVVDLETAPSAGNTSYAGGTVAYWTSEAGAISESEPALKLIRLVLHKLAALSLASAEVRVDARTSIDGLLARSFGRAVNAQKNYQFFRGDGVGKPKGVMESGALKATTRSAASAIALADVANMFSGFTPDSYGTGAWFVNPGAMAKLMQIADDPISYLPDLNASVPMRLLGLPVYVTGALPALNTAGDILLIDPQYYVIGEHVSGLSIAYSEHYKFNTDQHTWKVTQRVDGQPLIDSTITLENAVTTVSPFVSLAAG